MSVTLTEFLTLRLDEDEAVARSAVLTDGRWRAWIEGEGANFGGDDVILTDGEDLYVSGCGPKTLRHIARHDPARVLADVAAVREVLGLHSVPEPDQFVVYDESLKQCRTCGPGDHYAAQDYADQYSYPCDTLRVLARPYADHPDYDPAWA